MVELEEIAVHQGGAQDAGEGIRRHCWSIRKVWRIKGFALPGPVVTRVGVFHDDHFDLGRLGSPDAGRNGVALAGSNHDGAALQQHSVPSGRAAGTRVALRGASAIDLQQPDRAPAVRSQLEAAVVNQVSLALGRRLATLAVSGDGPPSRSSTSSTQRSPGEPNAM